MRCPFQRQQCGLQTLGFGSSLLLSERACNQNQAYAQFLANADKGNAYLTFLAIKVSLEQANSYFVPPAFNGSAYARNQVGALIVDILDMKGTTEEVKSKIDKKFMQAVELCECYYP